MFQLKAEEFHELARLTSQIAISNKGRGGRRTMPYVFTEQGVSMLSSVLNSERAIQVNIAIMRAFVRMRSLSSANRELASKVFEHEGKLIKHDRALREVFDAIRQLMGRTCTSPEEATNRILTDLQFSRRWSHPRTVIDTLSRYRIKNVMIPLFRFPQGQTGAGTVPPTPGHVASPARSAVSPRAPAPPT